MFQFSKSYLGADSPVNREFGIHHTITDHSVQEKETSQILFNKYKQESGKKSPRRKRMDRMLSRRSSTMKRRTQFKQ